MDDRRQFQHVAVLLGRTAWRQVVGATQLAGGQFPHPPQSRLADSAQKKTVE